MSGSSRAYLEHVLAEALASVDARAAVRRTVGKDSLGALDIAGRRIPASAGIWVAGLGKAAAFMASALVELIGDRLRGGLVITGDGHGQPLPDALPLRFAGHPVPDSRGARAARELLDCVRRIPASDVLVVLLSGGASAMTSLPEGELELSDLVEANRLLLECGADIHAINTVRKHGSSLAGGRLARAASCQRIEVLALSDVPGDSLSTLASGPCAGDPTTFGDALGVIDRFGLRGGFPGNLLRHLEAGERGELPESPFPGDPDLAGVHSEIVARNAMARAAAVAAAKARGADAVDLGEILTGEARVMGRRLAALARSARRSGPTLWVAGGETVVTLTGEGRGGRNQELALASALEWARAGCGSALGLLASGTDGRDGPTDAAGAFVDAKNPISSAPSLPDAQRFLDNNDSYAFFDAHGGLLRTGPTGTNVMDLVLIQVGGDAKDLSGE